MDIDNGHEVKQPTIKDSCVRVAIRCRPLNLLERSKNCKNVINIDPLNPNAIDVTISHTKKENKRNYKFNYCGLEVEQSDFFHLSGIIPLLDSALKGYAATVFAYGQTGAGKTFTMSGVEERLSDQNAATKMIGDPTSGIIPRSMQYLFTSVMKLSTDELKYVIKASYCEIYNEQVYDLLNATNESLSIRWNEANGFFVQSLLVVQCDSMEDIMAVVEEGHRNRRVGSHEMNKDSSRSHSIMTVYIEQTQHDSETNSSLKTYGKISFVDLAGSERLKETQNTNTKETSNINTSLFTLGKVISQLSARSSFVPYRDSNLTKLLMDSLGGSSLTLMIACIAPAFQYLEETLSTLNYASRTKNIRNKPTIHINPLEKLLYDLKRENALLRQENQKLKHLKEENRSISQTRQINSDRFKLPEIRNSHSLHKNSEPAESRIITPRTPRTPRTLRQNNQSTISKEVHQSIKQENNDLRRKINYLEKVFVNTQNDEKVAPCEIQAQMAELSILREKVVLLTEENDKYKNQIQLITSENREIIQQNNEVDIENKKDKKIQEENKKMARRIAHLQSREKDLMKALARKTRSSNINYE